jgi:hypothetical protein
MVWAALTGTLDDAARLATDHLRLTLERRY